MKSKVSYYILVIAIILTSFLYSLSDYRSPESNPLYGVFIVIVVILILIFAVLRILKYGEPQ